MAADSDSAKVTFPPPLMFVGMLLLGFGLGRLLPWSVNLTDIGRYMGGGILLLAGLYCLLAANGRFRSADNDVRPWKTTSAIVSDGIYRWTRNPMYLGMALVYLALTLAFSSMGALVLFPVLILIIRTQVIAREERYLEEKFGSEYLKYKQNVRRWL